MTENAWNDEATGETDMIALVITSSKLLSMMVIFQLLNMRPPPDIFHARLENKNMLEKQVSFISIYLIISCYLICSSPTFPIFDSRTNNNHSIFALVLACFKKQLGVLEFCFMKTLPFITLHMFIISAICSFQL